MGEGVRFPPVVLFHDGSQHYGLGRPHSSQGIEADARPLRASWWRRIADAAVGTDEPSEGAARLFLLLGLVDATALRAWWNRRGVDHDRLADRPECEPGWLVHMEGEAAVLWPSPLNAFGSVWGGAATLRREF